jgi:hypothetical protein
MKKIITALVALLIAPLPAFTMDVDVFGEIKTGFFYEQKNMKTGVIEHSRIHNNDGNSGKDEGRIRFGINLALENFGMRMLFTQFNFKSTDSGWVDFAYAYGNVFNNQLTLSAGLLGESPWGTGGPELRKELEYNGEGYPLPGIRVEWKPNFTPILNGLNLGFVLNSDNDPTDISSKEKFADLLLDSIAGIAYQHEYFSFRFAYRFSRPINSAAAEQGGEQFVYRVEEHLLGKILPGMQISANGYRKGIGEVEGRATVKDFQNWLYAVYDNDNFTAGFDVGYRDTLENNEQFLELRPSFYYKFFGNFLIAGLKAGMETGFNQGRYFRDGPFYNFCFLEPQLRLNFINSLYIAAVYRYTAGLYGAEVSYYAEQKTHWVNIRLCYTF